MALRNFILKRALFGIFLAFLLTGVSGGCTNLLLPEEDKIIRGIQIRGVELGNITKSEGLEKINFLKESIEGDTVTLVYEDQEWEFQAQDLGVEVIAEKIVVKAFQYGHQGNIVEQFKERRKISREGLEIPLYFTIDKKRLNNLLNEITKDLRITPQDATFQVKPDNSIEIIPGKNGTVLDYKSPYKKLYQIIDQQSDDALIDLAFVTTEPSQTTQHIAAMKLNGLVSSFSTTFSLAKANRSFNILVATKPFNNILVKPGQIISFNEVVGPRSSQNGYKPAPVILNGKLVDGLGGGVCQVSTTLFNAALLANLEIVKRSNHSLPVSYVPIGRDATVAYGSVDLKIKNNTDGYLLIKSSVSGPTVTFNIFGDTSKKKDIILTSESTETIPSTKVEYEEDPNYPKSKTYVKAQGIPGQKAKAYRIILENAKVVKKEFIASSYYKPQPKIIATGTNPAAKLKTPKAQPPKPAQPQVEQPNPPNPGNITPSNETNPPPTTANPGETVPASPEPAEPEPPVNSEPPMVQPPGDNPAPPDSEPVANPDI